MRLLSKQYFKSYCTSIIHILVDGAYPQFMSLTLLLYKGDVGGGIAERGENQI